MAEALEPGVERLSQLAALELGDAKVGGVSAGIVIEGRLRWTGSWGRTEAPAGGDATATARYAAASVTKLFTGLMLLQLADRGRLRLSDPVDRYVGEFRSVRAANDRAVVSLAQLATMTAGIPEKIDDAGEIHSRPPADFERCVLEALSRIALTEPGVRFLYSNLSYGLLGLACARAAGTAYDEYVQREILRPLGMSDSGFDTAADPHLARGYDLTDGRIDTETAEREHRGRGYGLPAGGLYSTVKDLARFVEFLIGGDARVISDEALAGAYDGVVAADRDLNFGEGLGFAALRDLRGRDVAAGHFGIVSGYKCGLVFDRASRAGLVVCTNVTRTPDTDDLSRGMIEILSSFR